MAYLPPEATIRPDVRYAWRGPSILIVEPDGWAGGHSLTGYYFRQTRFLKQLRFVVRGESPYPCSAAAVAPNALELTYIHPEVEAGGGGGSGSGRLGQKNGLTYRNLDLRLHYLVRPASLQVKLLITNRW